MRANGWRGNVRGRRKIRTTVPDPAHPRHPDLVNRDFRSSAPGELLVADFTYVPLAGGGFGYTAFVTGAFAGTILGWECSLSKATAFVQRAIAQAASHLRHAGPLPGRAVHHSDAGSQYTSIRFAETLMLAGIAPSVGSVGDAYDNALAETTIGLYKAECTATGRRSATARSPPWGTWRRSPPPGCTGTTASGSCTASSCGRPPKPTPSTGTATKPEPGSTETCCRRRPA